MSERTDIRPGGSGHPNDWSNIMGICIDRFGQVIINQGGRAHFTGWYSPAFHQAGKHQNYLQRGKSGWEGGFFGFEPTGPAIKYEGPLTKELFIQLTGWAPEK